jgi:hypothetical protein
MTKKATVKTVAAMADPLAHNPDKSQPTKRIGGEEPYTKSRALGVSSSKRSAQTGDHYRGIEPQGTRHSSKEGEPSAGGFDKLAMAADPEWINRWIQENGPYLYHGAHPRDGRPQEEVAQSILTQGLIPNQQRTQPPYPGESQNLCPGCETKGSIGDDGVCFVCGQNAHDAPLNPGLDQDLEEWWLHPRSNHVFMVTNPHQAYGRPLFRIDLRRLDPAKLKADDDMLRDYHPEKINFHKWTEPTETNPPRTLGEQAEAIGWGDNPEDTHNSFEQHGVVAHEGPIPPEAIERIDNTPLDPTRHANALANPMTKPNAQSRPDRKLTQVDISNRGAGQVGEHGILPKNSGGQDGRARADQARPRAEHQQARQGRLTDEQRNASNHQPSSKGGERTAPSQQAHLADASADGVIHPRDIQGNGTWLCPKGHQQPREPSLGYQSYCEGCHAFIPRDEFIYYVGNPAEHILSADSIRRDDGPADPRLKDQPFLPQSEPPTYCRFCGQLLDTAAMHAKRCMNNTCLAYGVWIHDKNNVPNADAGLIQNKLRQAAQQPVPTFEQLAPYRDEEGCYERARAIAEEWPHLEWHGGFYMHNPAGKADPDGPRVPCDHAWTKHPDGTIIDSTAQQFGYYHPEIVTPDMPQYKNYISYTEQPEQAQALAHQRGEHYGGPREFPTCPECNPQVRQADIRRDPRLPKYPRDQMPFDMGSGVCNYCLGKTTQGQNPSWQRCENPKCPAFMQWDNGVALQRKSAQQIMYHVAPVQHREVIEQEGLRHDVPSRWSDGPTDGVYLYSDPTHAENYAEGFNPTPHDIWEVNVDGLPIEADPEDYDQYEQDVNGADREDIPFESWAEDQRANGSEIGTRYVVPHTIGPHRLERWSNDTDDVWPLKRPDGTEIHSQGSADDQSYGHAQNVLDTLREKNSAHAARSDYRLPGPEDFGSDWPEDVGCRSYAEKVNELNPELRYTEGWTRAKGSEKKWGEHAWNVSPQGEIIDQYYELHPYAHKGPVEYHEHGPDVYEQQPPRLSSLDQPTIPPPSTPPYVRVTQRGTHIDITWED